MSENENLPTTAVKRELIQVSSPLALFDTGAFDQMMRVAQRLARSTMWPQHLVVFRKANGAVCKPDDPEGAFDMDGTVGNCLAIMNTARNWDMDVLAVAECTSFVKGKRCFEGKLVHGLLEQKLGRPKYLFFGDPATDGYGVEVRVEGRDDPQEFARGTVAEWKTDQWGGNRNNYRKRLMWRGVREWARMWSPGLLLGILTDDEVEDLRDEIRSRRATDVTPATRSTLADRLPGSMAASGQGPHAGILTQLREASGDVEDLPAAEDGESSGGNAGAAQAAKNPADDAGSDSSDSAGTAREATTAAGDKAGGQTRQDGKLDPTRSTGGEETSSAGATTRTTSTQQSGLALEDGKPADTRTVKQLLEDYSTALFRADTTKALTTLNVAFFAKVARPGADTPTGKALVEIMAAHMRRAKAEINADATREMVNAIVAKCG